MKSLKKYLWWFKVDPCGLFSSTLTLFLILSCLYVTVWIVVVPWLGFGKYAILYIALTTLTLVCHGRAHFSDPGYIPKTRQPPPLQQVPFNVQYSHLKTNYNNNVNGTPIHHNQHPQSPSHSYSHGEMNHFPKFSQKLKESPESNSLFYEAPPMPIPPRVCKRCRTIKPVSAHHCSTCNRCVVRLDHHCPWINNCVAIFNQKYFLLFLFYTAFLCTFSGTLLVTRFVSCTNFKALNRPASCTMDDISTISCIYNFIVALVFGLFVLIMFFDQLSAIFENTPGIDALQQRFGVAKGRYEALCDVFGEKLNWRWLLPFDLPPQVAKDFEDDLAEEEETAHIYAAYVNGG